MGNLGNVHPIGESRGTVKVENRDWELFTGNNGAMKVFTFVAKKQIPDFDADILPFFDHITSKHNFPADKQHLISMVNLFDLLRKY